MVMSKTSKGVHEPGAVDRRSKRCTAALAAVALAAAGFIGSVASVAAGPSDDAAGAPGLPPSMLLFGDEYDPDRPVPPIPEPEGAGIVAATLVVAGSAQVLEYEGDAKDLAAVVVDVRVAAGSTTRDFTAASVHARVARTRPSADASKPGQAALAGACVLSSDSAVTVTVAAGTRRAGWTVHVDDREFLCADASARLAVLMPGGSFRLSAKAGSDAGARLLLVFAASTAELSAVEFPGATVELPAATAR